MGLYSHIRLPAVHSDNIIKTVAVLRRTHCAPSYIAQDDLSVLIHRTQVVAVV